MKPMPKMRTRSGCFPCRLRRKKCDESQPMCAGCQRNHLICAWPTANGPSFSSKASSKPKASWREQLVSNAGGDAAIGTEGDPFRPRVGGPSTSTLWSDNAISCLSTPNQNWTALRSEVANHLFKHYVCVTAPQLAARVEPENPFLTHLLPLAFHDDKVLQATLALSGAHLCYELSYVEHDARSHLAVALRGVKHSLLRWRECPPASMMGLLATTLLLSLFECVIGDTEGTIFYHLRASRVILLELRNRHGRGVDESVMGFLEELYAFIAISANITLQTDFTVDRAIPSDSLLLSLDSLNRHSGIYGYLFGAAHQLFNLITPIISSARDLWHTENVKKRQLVRQSYEDQIKTWTCDTAALTDGEPVPTTHDIQVAGRIYQETLLIFLYTTFNGPEAPCEPLLSQVDSCLRQVIRHFRALPPDSPTNTAMMWPTLVAGSCMRTLDDREWFISHLSHSKITMWSVKRCIDLLGFLWQDQEKDKRVYGPYGLELTMRRRKLNVCCA